MNLATWICYLSILLSILQDFNAHQTNILNAQTNREIYTSTIDNLINDLYPLVFATRKAENKVFYLGQMLKQEYRNEFIKAMYKEV